MSPVPPYGRGITPPYLTPVSAALARQSTTALLVPTRAPETLSQLEATVSVSPVAPARLASLEPPGLANLRQVMLDVINRDRANAGIGPVQMDPLATQVAQAHAEEMAVNGYMSHWNLKGLGPDIRYSNAGGRDAVMENVYMSWQIYSNGIPIPVDDWSRVVVNAEAGWMSSPGHRANILMPEHTHVGIGVAYNPATGDIRMAQEFVNRYVELNPLPQNATLGDTLTVSGRMLAGVSAPLVNLAYEPVARAMTVAELNATSSYASPAQIVSAINMTVDSEGRFKVTVPLERGKPLGVYHVRLWVTWKGTSVLAAEPVVWVEK